jgi:hypothetical protein
VNSSLSNLVDHKRIVAVDATPVRAPRNSRHPGEHLLVNCHYDVSMARATPSELLSQARADVLEITRRLAAESHLQDLVSLVVTVYGHFPIPEAARPARCRVYRTNILYRDLPTDASLVTSDFFSRLNAHESSELDDVAELLIQPATLEPATRSPLSSEVLAELEHDYNYSFISG